MRKQQKKMTEDLIATLFEAHDEIRKYIKKGNLPVAMDLLGQCQDSAIQMGTIIESCEGEDFVTIGFIEDYCEAAYRIYEELLHQEQGNAKGASTEKSMKALNKKLINVENSVKNDIPLRTEAVFLPYKASMWDSLESVWKAADEDPSCDAYVIPIPYYDRTSDGSFGQMHYEADQYPDDVPVMHYEEYDFAKRQPDMIYIHNPYDEFNKVTSVHPFFYSKNLKNFTEKLVYIPYFILAEPTAFDANSLKGMAHFVTTPGVINADKVIVQSEAMKRAYVEVLSQAVGEENRGQWEEKIEGSGSPKLDKVMNTDREDVEIPEDWKRILEKPDGSWKKVIFYNTSVGALLEHDEKMLKKMRFVFDTFREHVDDVALLWRPHPLIKATIESMKPHLWEQYNKLVQEYQDEGWGIYDDTSDLDRAIALCDGYYGDQSSVVQLCLAAEKPVMVQNVDLLHDAESCDDLANKEPLYYWPSTFCIDGDDIWFVYGKVCILCRYSISLNEVQIVGTIPVENIAQESLFKKMVLVGNKLFLIPCWATNIVVYDIERSKFTTIEIEPYEGLKFNNVFLCDKAIICIPFSYPYVISVDVTNLKVTYECSLDETMKNDKISYFNSSTLLKDNQIALVSPQSNIIYLYNIESRKLRKECVVNNGCGFTSVVAFNDKIMLCDNKKIIVYNFAFKCFEKTFELIDQKSIEVHPLVRERFLIDDHNSPWRCILDMNLNLKYECVSKLIKSRINYYSYLHGICESTNKESIYFDNCDTSFNWIDGETFRKKVTLRMCEKDIFYIQEAFCSKNNKINKENEMFFYSLGDFVKGQL